MGPTVASYFRDGTVVPTRPDRYRKYRMLWHVCRNLPNFIPQYLFLRASDLVCDDSYRSCFAICQIAKIFIKISIRAPTDLPRLPRWYIGTYAPSSIRVTYAALIIFLQIHIKRLRIRKNLNNYPLDDRAVAASPAATATLPPTSATRKAAAAERTGAARRQRQGRSSAAIDADNDDDTSASAEATKTATTGADGRSSTVTTTTSATTPNRGGGSDDPATTKRPSKHRRR